MRYIQKYLAAVILLAAGLSLCHAIPQRPQPQRLVNDFAGILTGMQAERLEHALVAFDDSTSNQIAVVTVPDLDGIPVSEYATRIGIEWQVGSSDFNNGIVILVKPKTEASGGEVAISIGYGLEGAIPDVYCKRIIDNEMIPYFRNGDYPGGIYAACEVLMKLASGEISEPRGSDDDAGAAIIAGFLILIITGIVFFAIISSKGGGNNGGGGPSGNRNGEALARSIIIGSMLGSGRHSGGSSWGGRSGGGFGGFGGGSFGGGGASGSW